MQSVHDEPENPENHQKIAKITEISPENWKMEPECTLGFVVLVLERFQAGEWEVKIPGKSTENGLFQRAFRGVRRDLAVFFGLSARALLVFWAGIAGSSRELRKISGNSGKIPGEALARAFRAGLPQFCCAKVPQQQRAQMEFRTLSLALRVFT